MPCVNHPAVSDALAPCARCGGFFCPDCLVGRKAGWFCAGCDVPREVPAPAPARSAPAPPARVGASRVCTNHPEVVEGIGTCTRCDRFYCPDCLVELKGSRFCAGCKAEAVRDLQSGVGSGPLPLAGVGSRFLAQMVDGLVMWIALIPIIALLGISGAFRRPAPGARPPPALQFGFLFANVGLSAGAILYEGLMLQKRGQTLGKMALKIKVVSPDGSPISPGQAWGRTLLKGFVSGSCCLLGYLPVFFNPERATFHDLAARTRVVRLD